LGLRADTQTDVETDELHISVLQQSSGLPFARTQFINDEGEIVIRRHSVDLVEPYLCPLFGDLGGFCDDAG
jgi:hypothetical protein